MNGPQRKLEDTPTAVADEGGVRPAGGGVTVYAFVTFNEGEAQALGEYLAITEPLLEEAGAKIVERVHLTEDVVGKRPGDAVIVVKYPDRAAIDRVFQSKEYKKAIVARDKAFSEYSIQIAS